MGNVRKSKYIIIEFPNLLHFTKMQFHQKEHIEKSGYYKIEKEMNVFNNHKRNTQEL